MVLVIEYDHHPKASKALHVDKGYSSDVDAQVDSHKAIYQALPPLF